MFSASLCMPAVFSSYPAPASRLRVHTIPAPSPSSSSSLAPVAHWLAWALLLKTLREEFGATCSSFLGMLCVPLAPGNDFLDAAPFGFRQLWSGSSTSDSGDPTHQGPWAQQQLGKVSHMSCGSASWLKRRSPYVPAETCEGVHCGPVCSRETLETALLTI